MVKEWAYSNSLSALPPRRGLKQHWRTKLKSSVLEHQWHPRMLGNAIQAQERSIVRITFVRGKGKLGCTISNCFQILSFLSERVITKIECRHWHRFSRIIHFSLKCRMSGHSAKSETWPSLLSSHPPPVCCMWNQCSSGTLLHMRLRNDFWLMENCPIFQTNGPVSVNTSL